MLPRPTAGASGRVVRVLRFSAAHALADEPPAAPSRCRLVWLALDGRAVGIRDRLDRNDASLEQIDRLPDERVGHRTLDIGR